MVLEPRQPLAVLDQSFPFDQEIARRHRVAKGLRHLVAGSPMLGPDASGEIGERI
jgi:hypothetical protein